MLLETKGLGKKFGGITAVASFDITISSGEVLGLIGPNGAGKTTVMNLISGYLRPTEGRVMFESQDITRLPAHIIAQKGIARTFQIKNTFSHMSVLENVILALGLVKHASIYRALTGVFIHSIRYEEGDIKSRAMAILSNLGMDSLANSQASVLPIAQEKSLGLAMAIAGSPKLLLLDEPVAGMNREEMKTYMDFVVKYAQDTNTGILLVEHTMAAVMNYCSRIICIDRGQQIACGTAQAIRSDPKVQKAYLGEKG